MIVGLVDNSRFTRIALASSAEAETQLIVSNKLKYITKRKLGELSDRIDKLNRMIMALIKRL